MTQPEVSEAVASSSIPHVDASNVAARLRALLYLTQPSGNHDDVDPTSPARLPLPRRPSETGPKFLKIRIITWNMHDSIPKGDLEDLIGAVDPYVKLETSEEHPVFPNLAAEPKHPYHLIVVAGQECPSMSGMPMGIGAGFKLKDKDKELKERERDPEGKIRGEPHSYDKLLTKLRDAEADLEQSTGDQANTDEDELETPIATSGWTSLLENWLCLDHTQERDHNVLQPPFSPRPLKYMPKSHSSPDVNYRSPNIARKKGPYQLLVKERMMGLYLAVYINRDIRGLVKGTSRDAVAAGLLKGRVGNKGGVAVTVNLDGTSLLFVNAHLAAHEGKVAHRLANMSKIKSELQVDDFLEQDDPRVMSEDLTDRFDYTFLCGDLNFRMDVSRLHADWLIARKDFAQALMFDQLRNIMQRGEGFVGFLEAPITFPPTFKYDVRPSMRKRKSRRSLRHWKGGERRKQLTEIEELEHDAAKQDCEHEDSRQDVSHDNDDDDDDEADGEAEAGSLASSYRYSIQSRTDTEPEKEYFGRALSAKPFNAHDALAPKISKAAHKAKQKWLTLITPPSPASPSPWSRAKAIGVELLTPSGKSFGNVVPPTPSIPQTPHDQSHTINPSFLAPDAASDAQSGKTASIEASEEEGEDDSKGVYDSSTKQRVPSWCDRILFKSTVHAEPEPPEEPPSEYTLYRPRTKVGQFFAQALRPLASRSRQNSWGSGELRSSFDDSHMSAHSPTNAPVGRSAASLAIPRSATLDHIPIMTTTETASPQSEVSDPLTDQKQNFRLSLQPPTRNPNLAIRRSLSAEPAAAELPVSASLLSPQEVEVSPLATPKANITLPYPTPSKWPRFLPNFLTRDNPLSPSLPSTPIPDATPRPRKGGIICLDYNTLDDRAMKRLEGRSDHRPVIGSYAVYI